VVTEVANSANVVGASVDQVTNFSVKVRILRESYESIVDKDHPERAVFNPGMSATVDIRTKKSLDVLSVPILAVTTRDTTLKVGTDGRKLPGEDDMKEQDKIEVKDDKDAVSEEDKKEIECVFVVSDGKVKLTPVVTGIQDNNYFEIKSGLKEGDVVVAYPFNTISKVLKDKDEVEIVKKDELYSKDKK
jgi:HlyD family secretion protein